MPLGKGQRRIIKAISLVAGSFLVLALSAPVWFPWVLGPLARGAGLNYARYQRQGYSRFSLYGVTYADESVRLNAEQVEGFTPAIWFAQLVSGSKRKQQATVRMRGLHVEVLSTT